MFRRERPTRLSPCSNAYRLRRSITRIWPNRPAGETWQTISNRTGVSVSDLIAANPGMTSPKGKVFVPMAGNRVATIAYTRPATPVTTGVGSNVKVVKAVAGDTVAKLAARNGADATEVAKFNGLLPNSVLGAGREIKIPGK